MQMGDGKMKFNPSICIDLGLGEVLIIQHEKYTEMKLSSDFVYSCQARATNRHALVDDTGCVLLELEIGSNVWTSLMFNLAALEDVLANIRQHESMMAGEASPPTLLQVCKYSLLELTGVVERGGSTPGIANTVKDLRALISKLDPEWEMPE